MYGLVSTSLRIATTGAVAALFALQPLPSFAQSESPASCSLPVLDLANPGPGDHLSAGAYIVQGLALDPESPHGGGVNEVSFFLGPRDEGGLALGQTQPSGGPEQDTFSATLTLPSTGVGEREFVAYARSALSGKETQVSLPVVLGEDPTKAELAPIDRAESSTNPGAMPTCQGGIASTSVAAPLPAIAAIAALSIASGPVSDQPACDACNADNGQ
jgi:hypothetical protein